VCVVEGDFHSPSLHKYLGGRTSGDLRMPCSNPGRFENSFTALRKLTSRCSRAALVPELQAGWNSERLRSRIAELRREFSYVLVYSSQASQHMGGLLLGQIADGVILILESMVTRRETARTAKEDLTAANVKILGAVLNNHTFPFPKISTKGSSKPIKESGQRWPVGLRRPHSTSNCRLLE